MNPLADCKWCGAPQLKPFTAESKVELGTEYLVYSATNGEWDIAQWDGARWESTVRDENAGFEGDGYAVTHYQELPAFAHLEA